MSMIDKKRASRPLEDDVSDVMAYILDRLVIPPCIDLDDIAQDIALAILEKPSVLETYHGMAAFKVHFIMRLKTQFVNMAVEEDFLSHDYDRLDIMKHAQSNRMEPLADYLILQDVMNGALLTLTPREQYVIGCRFGIMNGNRYTYREIANSIGVTSERIRQLELNALWKLRHPSRAKHYRDLYKAL